MDSLMKMIVSFVHGLTGVLVSVIGLGIVASIVFGGSDWFVGDVMGNIRMDVDRLGSNGRGGVVVLLIILSVLNIK